MVKRLIIIATITGLAHIFTVLVLRQLASYAPVLQVSLVGETDSIVNLVIAVIAGGLVMSSVRDFAITEDWKAMYIKSQQARISLGILLMPLALFAYFSNAYFVFLISPVLAMNGDYLLYGRGKPVLAAILSFARVFFPSLAIMIASSLTPYNIAAWFGFATLVIYFLSGYFISVKFSVPYWYRPKWQSLKLYLVSLPTGIVSVSYYFMGLGLIAFGGNLYSAATIAVTYIAVKIYVIYKGVLRIITQSFFRDMVDDSVCLKIDMIGTLCGLAFFLSCACFSGSVSHFFFSSENRSDDSWILLTAATGLVISPFISLTSRVLLDKNDKQYAAISLMGMVISLITLLVFRIFSNDVYAMLLSLLLGEFFIVGGLLKITKLKNAIKERLQFLAKCFPLMVAPLLLRFFFGDNLVSLVAALGLFGMPAFLLNKNNFVIQRNPQNTKS